ncbi:hypothetical protein [Bosea sp. (in: a-proteobacteria)]|uniref:hypothetical protein n=1 Tax=Bosea sp. (in: a-proteobacteria) TaxID=1871050 RepID=UPI003569C798
MALIDENDPVQSVFAPVLGLAAWSVRKGQGSMLTFEFGNPSLHVREPIEPQVTRSTKVVARLKSRVVRPIGEWYLWIYCCNWRCIARGREIAHSESTDKRIHSAARELDGQRLQSVNVDPINGTSCFAFDLGAVLETWPYEDEDLDEQWSLQRRSGYIFAYRKDGRYAWSAPDVRSDQEVWLPLPLGKNDADT